MSMRHRLHLSGRVHRCANICPTFKLLYANKDWRERHLKQLTRYANSLFGNAKFAALRRIRLSRL